MAYVDGFVLVVPKKGLAAYKKLATKAAKIWRDHGALEYYECVGDDLKVKFGTPFPKMAKTKPTETVVFAWIVYKSKADRNRVNKAVMNDKRMQNMPAEMPFDCGKMAFGGFDVMVKSVKK